MEGIYLARLNKFIDSISALSADSRSLCTLRVWKDEDLEKAKILSSRLQGVLNRFSTELYQYFNAVNEPNADEVSIMTTQQLDGDETLAELNVRIQSSENKATIQPTTSQHTNRGKLPELSLPTFSGDVLQWTQFWDQFSSNIETRELRDVDKLMYLKSSLRGDAKTILDGLETTNDNYKIAVATLTDRYGRKSYIIDAHYATLHKLKKAESSEECRRTLDDIERHLRVLSSLGENIEHNHLRFLIMEKFPEDIIYELKLKLTNETIEELRKQLQVVLTAREDAKRTCEHYNMKDISYTTETLHVKETKPKNKPTIRKANATTKVNKKFKRSVTTFTKAFNKTRRDSRINEDREDQGPSSPKKRKLSCIFCKENHFNDECTTFKSVQQRKAKLTGRCYICLRLGHTQKLCRSKNATCRHCGKRGQHNRALCPTKDANKGTNINATLHVNERGSTILQTAIVNIKGPNNKSLDCRLLLDSGSMRSYVTQDVSDKLKLKTEENNHLTVFTFGSEKPQEMNSALVKLNIQSRVDKRKTVYANVVPSITKGITPHSKELSDWKHQEDYLLADDGSLSDRIDILIGNDYYHSIISSEKVKIRENLYLVNSDLGWILSGKSRNEHKDELSVFTYFQAAYETRLNEPDLPLDNSSMKVLWDLESIGITDSPKANRDDEAIQHFNKNTHVTEGRYHVSWPWKEYPPDLPTNYGLAYGRLVGLLKRLDKETLSAYGQTLSEQLQKGIIETVPEKSDGKHPIHYLPHHGVITNGKPIRLVYDASSKVKDTKSLNECLYCGPMMLEDLTGLLIKFRCHSVGITADVEKAFLQIGLNERDRDVTRFLWLKDRNKPVTEDNLIHYRFTRVPFGIICSPFLLNATIKQHLQNSDKQYAKQLAENIYVDNVLTGTKTVEDAMRLYKEGKEMFSEISMNLREWSSNSKQFLDQIPDATKETTIKTLGLNWNTKGDELSIRAKVNENNDSTKRGILKTIAAIYDPCGFSVPTMLSAKLLLQQLWKDKIKWDVAIPKNLCHKWKIILEEMKQVETICLPRNITIPNEIKAQLHCFTDSSAVAYAAVIYLVQGDKVNFVIGKSRLVPIKDQDNLKIPRLELLGVLIGSRLIKYVLRFIQLEITQLTLWTDSQIVINWYNSDKLLEPFVSKRLQEIKQNKDLIVRHVPSELNPADVATRPAALESEKRKWLAGPDFLRRHPETWPEGVTKNVAFLSGEGLSRTEQRQIPVKESVRTLNSELQDIKQIQEKAFPEELKGKRTSITSNLGLFIDTDGILRCDGRLNNADLSYDAKHPILLPKHSEFTERLINEIHKKNLHVGVPHTLSLIRQKYWIPQGRTRVQKVISKCARCVKHGGGPYELPKTPALPAERVNYTSSFTYTGTDYFGPMVIKTENGLKKRWICLFTCLVIRAIHLEVVKDLTTEECLMAFRRFVATRGNPSIILTDNAPQFRLLAEVISEEGTVGMNLKWKFIPQLAPWHGGAYERLVALVKHCLKRTLEKHMLQDNQLSTIIKEVEAVVNSRPLTYVGSDLDHILKPADFLTPGKCLDFKILTERLPFSGSIIKQQLIEGWKRGNVIMDEYKEMFINRYLLSLRERYRNSPRQARVRTREAPRVGDIVQIKGETKNREGWKVGRIEEVIKGKDGLCRVAKVKVGNHMFTRSIAHLYPLEVDEEETHKVQTNELFHQDTFKGMTADTSKYDQSFQTTPLEEEMDEDKATTSTKQNPVKNMSTREIEIENVTRGAGETAEDMETIDDTEFNQDQELFSFGKDTQNDEGLRDQSTKERQRRAAAVQALEKIHKWTSDLMSNIN